MVGPKRIALGILFFGVLFLPDNFLQGGKVNRSDSFVKVTVAATKADGEGKQIVTLTMMHDKNYHTYANPVGLDDLSLSQTVVTITSKVKPVSVKIDYPVGKTIKNNEIGNYNVYEGKIEIPITVKRAQEDSGPLEIKVRFRADHNRGAGPCCLPAAVKFMVP